MKLIVLLPLLAVSVLAQASFAQEGPLCIDASRDSRYNARPISLHDVLARNAFGSDRRAARLSTSCIHVDRSALVSLHSLTSCVAKGDEVATSSIDGRRETCRVTGIAAAPESYAEAKYKAD
jgi:hypothetical protein